MTSTLVEPVPAPPATGTYDKALIWLRTAKTFAFVLDEAGVHAEGRMRRETVGAETVDVKVNGEEWRAKSGAQGVTWERRGGGKWSAAAAPVWGNRVFQRVTLAFDPQKKEGTAQLAGSEGTANHYRFTNANTGEVHDVWVAQSDNHVERIKIGNAFEMKITP